jgi:hypothetical protein
MLDRSKFRRQLMTTLLALGSLGVLAGATPAAADYKDALGRTCVDTCKAHDGTAHIIVRPLGIPAYKCRAHHEPYGYLVGMNVPYATNCLVLYAPPKGEWEVHSKSIYKCWCNIPTSFRRKRAK